MAQTLPERLRVSNVGTPAEWWAMEDVEESDSTVIVNTRAIPSRNLAAALVTRYNAHEALVKASQAALALMATETKNGICGSIFQNLNNAVAAGKAPA